MSDSKGCSEALATNVDATINPEDRNKDKKTEKVEVCLNLCLPKGYSLTNCYRHLYTNLYIYMSLELNTCDIFVQFLIKLYN